MALLKYMWIEGIVSKCGAFKKEAEKARKDMRQVFVPGSENAKAAQKGVANRTTYM